MREKSNLRALEEALNGKVNPLVTIRIHSSGNNIGGVNLLLLFPDNTWKQAATDKNGEAKVYLYSTKMPMTIFAAAENYSAYLKKDWMPLEGTLTIELQELVGGGSIIFPNATGYIPGLEGRLNPILDTLNRTYFYADNIAINGGKQHPVNFTFEESLHLQDSNGIEKIVYIIDIRGKSVLLKYHDTSETKQKE